MWFPVFYFLHVFQNQGQNWFLDKLAEIVVNGKYHNNCSILRIWEKVKIGAVALPLNNWIKVPVEKPT